MQFWILNLSGVSGSANQSGLRGEFRLPTVFIKVLAAGETDVLLLRPPLYLLAGVFNGDGERASAE